MRKVVVFVVGMLIAAMGSVAVVASEWTVAGLHAPVHYLEYGEWQTVAAGERLPAGVILRTGHRGGILLYRGRETMELGPNTQIRIVDEVTPDRVTNVYQDSGTLHVEVEKRDAEHFAVISRHLAAVVKGTRFVVRVGKHGGTVDVRRGTVRVHDSRRTSRVDIEAGQRVEARQDARRPLTVSGEGALPPVINSETGEVIVIPEPAREQKAASGPTRTDRRRNDGAKVYHEESDDDEESGDVEEGGEAGDDEESGGGDNDDDDDDDDDDDEEDD